VRLAQAAFLLGLLAGALPAAMPVAAETPASPEHAGRCRIQGPTGQVQHVVYLVFDNVHLTRDLPNVPSDLEQMPHLLDFLTSNGVVLANNHTGLIAHTATGILNGVTGLYPDSHGIPVANSFRYFREDGTTASAPAFGYWTAPLSASHPVPLMIDKRGKNAPAPWVTYTRAGCDFGAVATANTILENVTTDIDAVFGPDSEEKQEALRNPQQANRDFVGIGVHCAQARSSVCVGAPHARPDVLPDEPGGYAGYQMLQGHKYVAEKFPITAIGGAPITGFPGFDGMVPDVTLGYAASMLEAGVPVVYGYLSDAHDNHTTGTGPFGPGEAGYVQQLREYDAGFAGFFERLRRDHITADNTLFVVTVDEGDHPDVGPPQPHNCDGVHHPCTYDMKGEVAANLRGLVATQTGVDTLFTVHSDSSPTVYVEGNPDQLSDTTRNLERATGAVTADNPYTGREHVVNYLADQAGMGALHMLTADRARHPTFTAFGKEWYFLTAGPPNCNQPCISIDPGFIWIHGTFHPTINNIWMAFAGPGVRRVGVDHHTWADQVDTRATMMALLGLEDDYVDEGRVLYEDLQDAVVPRNVQAQREPVLAHQRTLKQLDAPLGQFGVDGLKAADAAVRSDTPRDREYRRTVNEINRLVRERDGLAAEMLGELRAIEYEGQRVRPALLQRQIDHANRLIDRMHGLAGGGG
jgi:hypothetical protein